MMTWQVLRVSYVTVLSGDAKESLRSKREEKRRGFPMEIILELSWPSEEESRTAQAVQTACAKPGWGEA